MKGKKYTSAFNVLIGIFNYFAQVFHAGMLTLSFGLVFSIIYGSDIASTLQLIVYKFLNFGSIFVTTNLYPTILRVITVTPGDYVKYLLYLALVLFLLDKVWEKFFHKQSSSSYWSNFSLINFFITVFWIFVSKQYLLAILLLVIWFTFLFLNSVAIQVAKNLENQRMW